LPNKLTSFNIHSITKGIDAQGEVTTQLEQPSNGEDMGETNPQTGERRNRTFTGHAADVDIVVASVRSYLHALNKMEEFN
jgi:2-isopropylmalate synthase